MYQVGLSSCGKIISCSLFREFADNGITHIELSQKSYDDLDFPNLRKFSQEYGVNLWSLHLPFDWEIEISSLNPSVRTHTMELFSELIKRGSEVGIRNYIVHPSGEPIADTDRRECMLRAQESLTRLADISASCGSVICVEDLPRTCLGHSIAEMQTLLSCDDRLRFCFDTNHIVQESPEDIIAALADKLVTIHVSDFDGIDECHWLPGEGCIAWDSLLAALDAAAYTGVFLYEIDYVCPSSILRDRDLTAADFRRNADEIFAGKPLTVLSRPNPNFRSQAR